MSVKFTNKPADVKLPKSLGTAKMLAKLGDTTYTATINILAIDLKNGNFKGINVDTKQYVFTGEATPLKLWDLQDLDINIQF